MKTLSYNLSGKGRIHFVQGLIASGARKIDRKESGMVSFISADSISTYIFNRRSETIVVSGTKVKDIAITDDLKLFYNFYLSSLHQSTVSSMELEAISYPKRVSKAEQCSLLEMLLELEKNVESTESLFHMFNMEVLTYAIERCPQRAWLINDLFHVVDFLDTKDYVLHAYRLLSIINAKSEVEAEKIFECVWDGFDAELNKEKAINQIQNTATKETDDHVQKAIKKLILAERFNYPKKA